MSNAQLRGGFIAAIMLIGILIGFGVLKYPLIVTEAGVVSLLGPAFMLLLYGAVAIRATHQPSHTSSDALKAGTASGLLVGITFVATIWVENFADLSGQASTISTLSFMLLIFLIFACTGWYATTRSKQLSSGIFASVWGAMIGVVIAILFGFAINFLFTHRLEQNLQASAEYLRSGSHDLETFTFWNTLDSAFSHLLEAPIIAAVLGTLGSLISLGSTQLRDKLT